MAETKHTTTVADLKQKLIDADTKLETAEVILQMALTPLIEALREKQEEKDEKVAKLKDLKANIKQEKKA